MTAKETGDMSSSPAQKGSQYRGRLHKRATRSRFHFDVKSSSVQVIAAIPIPSAVSQARRKGTKKGGESVSTE